MDFPYRCFTCQGVRIEQDTHMSATWKQFAKQSEPLGRKLRAEGIDTRGVAAGTPMKKEPGALGIQAP
jgi:hypothetical protein